MAEIAAEEFSYASADDPPVTRAIIHAIERLTGQPYLRWLYECYRHHPVAGESFWDAAVRLLELTIRCDWEKLASWPKQGPLVVVCNHPFGVLDGLVACQILSKVRPDFRVLTNAVLVRAEEIAPYLLPIDFSETREALQTNLQSRNDAIAHLKAGGCMLIFPSGGVSTTPHIWAGRAVDTEWKTFTARMITQTRASVAPLYFAGQNSRLFQLISHVSLTLRLALLFHEVHNKIGSEVAVAVGTPIPYAELASMPDRQELMLHLRHLTYRLGRDLAEPRRTKCKRPRRAPKTGTPVPGLAAPDGKTTHA